MKVAIIGGHMGPALSVIDALPSDTEIIFIGRKYLFEGDKTLSLEYQVITDRHIPFFPLSAGRLQRKLTKHSIQSLLKAPKGVVQAVTILKENKPSVVVGFGGYLSLPVCVAAQILRIPIVIHEQTQDAGLANKIIGHFAKKICISWDSSKRYFAKDKIVVTGNPIRKEIIQGVQHSSQRTKPFLPLLYITGGSSGSHAINVLIGGCLEELLKKCQIIHQTGDAQEYKDYELLYTKRKQLPEALQMRYTIMKYVPPKEVGELLIRANVVISRSGINTITELLYLEKPSILIPLPHGQNNEQLKNALLLKKFGLAEVLEQNSLTSEKLYQAISEMLERKDTYKPKEKVTIEKNAAKKIVEVITYATKKS